MSCYVVICFVCDIEFSVDVGFFMCLFFFFKQKTAYEMRISDWSSDVCSSDLDAIHRDGHGGSCLKPSSWKGAPSPFGSSAHPANDVQEIGRASCRERVCQYV